MVKLVRVVAESEEGIAGVATIIIDVHLRSGPCQNQRAVCRPVSLTADVNLCRENVRPART